MKNPTTRRDVRRRPWFMITGLAAGHGLFHWLIQGFVVALPEIQSAFHLNGVGIGAAIAIREAASGIVALPGGVIVDALRRHWGAVFAGCLFVLGLGALVMGISPIYPLLLLGMAMAAMAHSLWHLPAAASLSHHFPRSRGMALSFHGVGGGMGDVAGPLVTGGLLMFLGWRGIISIYGAIPLFLAYLALIAFKNIGRDDDLSKVEPRNVDQARVTRLLLRDRVLWTIALVRGMRSMALSALVTVLPLYLDNELAMTPLSRGFHVGLLIVVGIAAKPVAGRLSDTLGRKSVLVPGLLWSGAMCVLVTIVGHGLSLTALVALMGLFLYPDQPVLTAALLDRVDQRVASTAVGLVSFIGFLMSATSPMAAGGLYEFVGVDATFFYVAALFFLAAAALTTVRLRPPGHTG